MLLKLLAEEEAKDGGNQSGQRPGGEIAKCSLSRAVHAKSASPI
jgi:hypothetical protein